MKTGVKCSFSPVQDSSSSNGNNKIHINNKSEVSCSNLTKVGITIKQPEESESN